ncbi:MAG: hypothetical protein HRU19_27690 [Pseudobacteriovorax sp.]|nr:hypothetical protein [Pseudobacteriovorax sp.]
MAISPLYEDVQRLYDDFLARYNRKTAISSIARRCEVPVSTVRRLIQGEASTSFENTVAIVSVLTTRANLAKFIERHFPKMSHLFTETYQEKDATVHLPGDEIISLLKDETTDFVYNLASTQSGTSRKQVERLRGEHGLDKLDLLLEKEFLKEGSGGQIHNPSPDFSVWDVEANQRSIGFDVQRLDRSLIGTDAAGLMKQTESTNEKGIKELKRAFIDFASRVAEIKGREDCQGDIPFFMSTVYSVLDKSKLTGEAK